MALYRKKPVVIEAFQWTGRPEDIYPVWFEDAVKISVIKIIEHGNKMAIQTLEGTHIASLMDWIIRGVKKELYACKPDIFEMTYERVE